MTKPDSQEWIPENLSNAVDAFDVEAYQQLPVRPLYKAKPRSFVALASNPDMVYFYYVMDGAFVECFTLNKQKVRVDAYADVIPLERKKLD